MSKFQPTFAQNMTLLAVGLIMLSVPLLFLMYFPGLHNDALRYLHVFTSLGGGLVGASIPGLLHVEFPYARGGGALGVFLLIYVVDLPEVTVEAASPPRADTTVALQREDLFPADRTIAMRNSPSERSEPFSLDIDARGVMITDGAADDEENAATNAGTRKTPVFADSWAKAGYSLQLSNDLYLNVDRVGDGNVDVRISNNRVRELAAATLNMQDKVLRYSDSAGDTYEVEFLKTDSAGLNPFRQAAFFTVYEVSAD